MVVVAEEEDGNKSRSICVRLKKDGEARWEEGSKQYYIRTRGRANSNKFVFSK